MPSLRQRHVGEQELPPGHGGVCKAREAVTLAPSRMCPWGLPVCVDIRVCLYPHVCVCPGRREQGGC